MTDHPDPSYSKPDHVFDPNDECSTLSLPQHTTLAQSSVQLPYFPPVRVSLKRKLSLPAAVAEEAVHLVAIILHGSSRNLRRRYAGSGKAELYRTSSIIGKHSRTKFTGDDSE